MKESTRVKFTAEMLNMASMFCGSNTKFGYKQAYKAWQRQLNAYNDYFDVLAEVYPARTKAAKTRLESYLERLFKTTKELRDQVGFMINRDKRRLPKFGVFGNKSTFEEFTKEITKTMVNWQAMQAKKSSVKAVSPVVVSAPVKEKTKAVARGPLFGTRRVNLDAPKKTPAKKAGKSISAVPVQLTIGAKVVDLGPLLAIPAVKKYIEEQTLSVVKEANLAKAQELQAQIESLGFEVTLR